MDGTAKCENILSFIFEMHHTRTCGNLLGLVVPDEQVPAWSKLGHMLLQHGCSEEPQLCSSSSNGSHRNSSYARTRLCWHGVGDARSVRWRTGWRAGCDLGLPLLRCKDSGAMARAR
eukprot:757698-Amphidinium_carterae.1